MLKRFILWDFKRGSWQYDVVVGIILAFIFLTPREVFRDGQRLPQPHGVAVLPMENGTAFYVDPALLKDVPENHRESKVQEILQKSTSNRRLQVTRMEPFKDSDGELQGYMVFTQQ